MTGVVSGIVLAGGRSSRFGSSKLDADLGGATVLERTIDALRPVCDELIVVGRAGSLPGVRYLPDERPFEGPAAGLATGLAAATGEMALVVGGDMPVLGARLLRLLLEALRSAPGMVAVVLEEAGEPRPLPAAVRRGRGPVSAANQVAAAVARGERSLRAVLTGLAASTVAEADWRAVDPDGDTLVDVDVPDDLERVRRLIHDGGTA
jgi:molybdopterin-guanine dinucleotide biosynthesis protein A